MALLATALFLVLPHAAQAVSTPSFLQISRAASVPEGARNLCRTYSWACSKSRSRGRIHAAHIQTLSVINRDVNRRVRAIPDQAQFRVAEVWSLPTARGGDCEDFALAKKQELIGLGFPPEALLIATVLDKRRQGHAVLIARTDAGDLVLDNLTNRIKHWHDTGYIFLRMQNPDAPSRWVNVKAPTG